MLYEPHIYHKLLPAAKRTEAITKNLARKTADKTYYNQFEKTPDDRWDLLDRATAFHDFEAAVGSCSWGPAQIVASIWAKAIGYASVADFARAAMDEGKMLDAFAAVLAGMKLKSAINDLDFESVARTYNGSGAVEVYAGRMQKAFDGL